MIMYSKKFYRAELKLKVTIAGYCIRLPEACRVVGLQSKLQSVGNLAARAQNIVYSICSFYSFYSLFSYLFTLFAMLNE